MEEVFQQNLDDKKGPQPGGPYLIQMLFKEPVSMPDKNGMIAVMEKHIGKIECFCPISNTIFMVWILIGWLTMPIILPHIF